MIDFSGEHEFSTRGKRTNINFLLDTRLSDVYCRQQIMETFGVILLKTNALGSESEWDCL